MSRKSRKLVRVVFLLCVGIATCCLSINFFLAGTSSTSTAKLETPRAFKHNQRFDEPPAAPDTSIVEASSWKIVPNTEPAIAVSKAVPSASHESRSFASSADVLKLISEDIDQKIRLQEPSGDGEPALADVDRKVADMLIPHLGLFVSQSQPELVLDNGKILGVALQSIGPDSLLSKFGLKSGDLITTVGNQPIVDPFDLVDHITSASDGFVDISIERNKAKFNLKIRTYEN